MRSLGFVLATAMSLTTVGQSPHRTPHQTPPVATVTLCAAPIYYLPNDCEAPVKAVNQYSVTAPCLGIALTIPPGGLNQAAHFPLSIVVEHKIQGAGWIAFHVANPPSISGARGFTCVPLNTLLPTASGYYDE